MPNPVTGKIGILELPGFRTGPGVAIQGSEIDQGAVSPNNLGQTMRNQSGAPIPAGSLVYVSGVDATTGLLLISLAAATAQQTRAQWVTLATIANNANGPVGLHYMMTGLNTGGATQGDPVYLSTVAGGVNASVPTGSSLIYQVVGRVAVVSATVGVIQIDLLAGSGAPAVYRAQVTMPQIGTAAGAYTGFAIIQTPGIIVGARAVFPTALAISGTNYVTITGTDLVGGSGTNALLAVGATINTTFTGGTAITANTAYPLTLSGTPANLVVAAGDIVQIVATVTGTLGAAIAAGAVVSLAIQPT